MSYFVFYCYVFICRQLGNQLPRLGKREINFLLLFTCKQRTNGPVNAHLIYWSSKAQNIQNLENIW